VATVPARQPGVRLPGADAGARAPIGSRVALLALNLALAGLVAYVANRIKLDQGIRAHDSRPAIWAVLRVGGAAVALFGVAGFGITRLALPPSLRRHELLWVLPIGACMAALELTALGYAGVPFHVSLAVVLALGVALAVLALRRAGPPAAPRPIGAVAWPLYVAAIIAAIALIPMFRAHFATVEGDGSDAHLAVGTAQFLQHHYPTSTVVGNPVDKVPLVWRSKTPIYYALAATSSLSGLEPYQAISTTAAVMLALAALGFFLLARELLASNLLGAVAGMALVGLDRMVLHTIMHPYFNQTWGFFTLAFATVLAWTVIGDGGRMRTRGAVALLLLFLAIGAFAYPLAAPIPVLALLVFWWRDRRERRARGERVTSLDPRRMLRGRGQATRWTVAALAVVLIVPLLGVVEKLSTGLNVAVDPATTLRFWAGDLGAYFPENQFLSLGSTTALYVGAPLLALAVWLALRRRPAALRWGLLAVFALGAFGALWFRERQYGQYFHFKLLAFVGPLLVLVAAVGLSRLVALAFADRGRPRLATLAGAGAGVAAIVAFFATALTGAHDELAQTANELPKTVIAVRTLERRLGPGRSIRLDMNPSLQLWVAYFLAGEPLCSQRPLLATSYPHVALSRKADYILADHGTLRPFDADGPPVTMVGQFRLYRERPDVPGPSLCSLGRVQTVTAIGS
jgi:hypothetical protein